MRKLVTGAIDIYQKTISPDHGAIGRVIFGSTCRYNPTCSQYAREAVEKYGTLKGTVLGVKRILRCNPFSKGGFDPVP